MIKVKINLLPKEIRDRRRLEKMIISALLGILGVAAILICIYLFNAMQISKAEEEVATLKRETSQLDSTIGSMRIYETKLQAIQAKQVVVEKATAVDVRWSKTLAELMIVTPNDVSIETLNGNSDGIAFTGSVLDLKDDPDMGHKPVANWLMRLADMNPQPDVWLTSSDKNVSSRVVRFTNSMKFNKSGLQPTPPTPSGK